MQPRLVRAARTLAVTVPVSVSFLLFGLGQPTARADPVDDLLSEAAAKAALSLDPYLWTLPVMVTAKDGRITVSGTVELPTQKRLIMRKISHVVDPSAIVDMLVISSAQPANETQRRAPADVVNDVRTAVAVRRKLRNRSDVALYDLRVRASSGSVTLDGEAETPADKAQAGRLADEVDGVVHVDNRLRVRGEGAVDEPAVQTERSWKKRLHDVLIAGQARKVLDRNDELGSSRIRVDVRDGVVTLSGEVPDEDKLLLAEQLMVELRGVATVKNELQVKQ